MALITNAIKGTLDTLPSSSYKIQYIEAAMREIAENYGFYEMRTPVFEHTEKDFRSRQATLFHATAMKSRRQADFVNSTSSELSASAQEVRHRMLKLFCLQTRCSIISA